jgi:hypothetical protein
MSDVLDYIRQTPAPLHRRATDNDGWSRAPISLDR